MTPEVSQILVGPRRHGVVRFGRDLHAALQQQPVDVGQLWLPDICDMPPGIGGRSRLIHLQFTDRLFGPSPEAAASAFAALARILRADGSALTATLHDLPQPSDGIHYRARIEAYRMVAVVCDAVAVNSEHERELLRENMVDDEGVFVIPLPIAVATPNPGPRNQAAVTLGVFGFIYPGKGHSEVVAAAAGLPPEVEVHAIGCASAGHEGLLDQIRCAAARQRRMFRVTGHVDDDRLVSALRAITVPVVAHRHISASGSLNSWLTAGRRPLAPVTRYTTEVERRNPGCLQLFSDSPAGLRSAIHASLGDPASTWLPTCARLHPSPAESAAAYTAMFQVIR